MQCIKDALTFNFCMEKEEKMDKITCLFLHGTFSSDSIFSTQCSKIIKQQGNLNKKRLSLVAL